MKKYKDLNDVLWEFNDCCFDENGVVINDIVNAKIEENSLMAISDEEYIEITEKNTISESEIRKVEIYTELENIDIQTIRPLRAKLVGLATVQDEVKLLELETKANSLRTELKSLV